MIISASRRCDIPNYKSDWFLEGIKNEAIIIPYNPFIQKRISLKREDVDCIVFWTKNPEPMIGKLNKLDGYPYYFQFTLTGYSKKIEPGVPDKHHMLDVFKKLSEQVGAERVIWRYDPIFMSPIYTVDYHKQAFQAIAEALAGYTETCVISFVDIYGKLRYKMDRMYIREPRRDEIYELAAFFTETAARYGIRIESCAELIDLSQYGIKHGHCIDAGLIEKISGKRIPKEKDPSQRPACGCCKSIDIGTYHSCKNGCVYCYA